MLWVYQAGEEKGTTAAVALSGLQVMVPSALGGSWQLKDSRRERDVASMPFAPECTAPSTLGCIKVCVSMHPRGTLRGILQVWVLDSDSSERR